MTISTSVMPLIRLKVDGQEASTSPVKGGVGPRWLKELKLNVSSDPKQTIMGVRPSALS